MFLPKPKANVFILLKSIKCEYNLTLLINSTQSKIKHKKTNVLGIN